jgi:hypothetical protein
LAFNAASEGNGGREAGAGAGAGFGGLSVDNPDLRPVLQRVGELILVEAGPRLRTLPAPSEVDVALAVIGMPASRIRNGSSQERRPSVLLEQVHPAHVARPHVS